MGKHAVSRVKIVEKMAKRSKEYLGHRVSRQDCYDILDLYDRIVYEELKSGNPIDLLFAKVEIVDRKGKAIYSNSLKEWVQPRSQRKIKFTPYKWIKEVFEKEKQHEGPKRTIVAEQKDGVDAENDH